MSNISPIYNSGIRFHESEERLVIDSTLNERVLGPLCLYGYDGNGKIKLEGAYCFSGSKQRLRRSALLTGRGYLHSVANRLMDENDIDEAMNWLAPQNFIRIKQNESEI